MSIALYGVGYLIVIVAVLYFAHLMHIPQTWTVGIGLLMLGIGVVALAQMSRGSGGGQA